MKRYDCIEHKYKLQGDVFWVNECKTFILACEKCGRIVVANKLMDKKTIRDDELIRGKKAERIFKELRRKDIHKNSPIKVRTTDNEELIAFKRKDFDKIEAKHCGEKE